MGAPSEFTVEMLRGLGVRRIQRRCFIARAAWGGFIRAANALHDGNFDGFKDAASGGELGKLFRDDAAKRRTHSVGRAVVVLKRISG
jgi:hypothetical protein